MKISAIVLNSILKDFIFYLVLPFCVHSIPLGKSGFVMEALGK